MIPQSGYTHHNRAKRDAAKLVADEQYRRAVAMHEARIGPAPAPAMRGSGWRDSPKLESPPGVALADKLMDVQDAKDRAQLEMIQKQVVHSLDERRVEITQKIAAGIEARHKGGPDLKDAHLELINSLAGELPAEVIAEWKRKVEGEAVSAIANVIVIALPCKESANGTRVWTLFILSDRN
jgi:hypothetical protein